MAERTSNTSNADDVADAISSAFSSIALPPDRSLGRPADVTMDATADATAAGEPSLLEFDCFDGSDCSTSPRPTSQKASPRPSKTYDSGVVSAVASRLDALLERFG